MTSAGNALSRVETTGSLLSCRRSRVVSTPYRVSCEDCKFHCKGGTSAHAGGYHGRGGRRAFGLPKAELSRRKGISETSSSDCVRKLRECHAPLFVIPHFSTDSSFSKTSRRSSRCGQSVAANRAALRCSAIADSASVPLAWRVPLSLICAKATATHGLAAHTCSSAGDQVRIWPRRWPGTRGRPEEPRHCASASMCDRSPAHPRRCHCHAVRSRLCNHIEGLLTARHVGGMVSPPQSMSSFSQGDIASAFWRLSAAFSSSSTCSNRPGWWEGVAACSCSARGSPPVGNHLLCLEPHLQQPEVHPQAHALRRIEDLQMGFPAEDPNLHHLINSLAT